MNLAQLLSELRGNILRDDAALASGPQDRLWSDDTLVRYINDAYLRFARRTLVLRDDSTPEVVEVVLDATVAAYTLHPSIISVVSGRYDVNPNDLTRVGRVIAQYVTPPDTITFDPNWPAALNPGPPFAFTTDEMTARDGQVQLRMWPTPRVDEAGKVIFLRVARKPLVLFTLDDTEHECEIPEEYQLDMLEWAAYRAQCTSDIDGASASADKHMQMFERAIGEVLRDMRRKMFAPMQWYYGRNGWSWSV